VLWGTPALAQTADYPDPLTPRLQSDPRNPQCFQKFCRPALAPLSTSAGFSADAAAGTGDTGFDSTNSRKETKGKAKTKSPARAQAIAPGLPAPVLVSRYQKQGPISAAGAYAQAPGTLPAELGPIRRVPPKRNAHSEPDDPYAPLGVYAGAFTLFSAIELVCGYDTNPERTSGAQGAALCTIAPELQVQSNWSRHQLNADLRGNYTGYSPDATPTLSRPNVNGKVDGCIDVSKDTQLISGAAYWSPLTITVARTCKPISPRSYLCHLWRQRRHRPAL
jgi:hypothetical protein